MSSSFQDGMLLYPLFCSVCRLNLNSSLQAEDHFRGRKHSKKFFHFWRVVRRQQNVTRFPEFCFLCRVAFNSQKQAAEHIFRHLSTNDKSRHICFVCGDVQPTKRNLQQHIQRTQHFLNSSSSSNNNNNNGSLVANSVISQNGKIQISGIYGSVESENDFLVGNTC